MESPKLRKVERVRMHRGEQALIVVRDPLNLSEPIAIDEAFEPILDLLDGSRTLRQVRQSLLMGANLDVPESDLRAFVLDLDAAGLLDGARFQAMWKTELERFEASTSRPAQLGELYYPGDRVRLSSLLGAILPRSGDRFDADAPLLGVLCPHQPFELARRVLGATLVGLPPAEQLDGIVVLGTDHNPGLLPYVLTDKHYETPIGRVLADVELVAEIEARVPWVRREHLRHRHCASLEIAAVLLQHLYADRCPPVLFVLCGLTSLSSDAASSQQVDELLATLEVVLSRRRVLWWGSAELSHAGPAYGHPPLDPERALAVQEHDRACLDSLIAGRHEQLVRRCLEDQGQGKPSGTATMTTLARLLPVGYRARLAAYEAVGEPGGQPGQLGIAGVRFFEG